MPELLFIHAAAEEKECRACEIKRNGESGKTLEQGEIRRFTQRVQRSGVNADDKQRRNQLAGVDGINPLSQRLLL